MSDLAALIAAARDMLPEGVGLGWADPRLDHPLLPGEALSRAVPKRQREFSAGRAAARMAMGRPDLPVPMQINRAPLWPVGICGSISHSDTACLAIAAPTTLFKGLGVDLEPARPLDRVLWETVLTASEVERLKHVPEAEKGMTAKLIFCAKEAGYKAQFTTSEQMFGFDQFNAMITERKFILVFTSAVCGFPKFSELHGRWRSAGGHILTLVTIPP